MTYSSAKFHSELFGFQKICFPLPKTERNKKKPAVLRTIASTGYILKIT